MLGKIIQYIIRGDTGDSGAYYILPRRLCMLTLIISYKSRVIL